MKYSVKLAAVWILTATFDILAANSQSIQPHTERIFRSIAESEYNIRLDAENSRITAPNRKQNLRFTFWADGFEVVPRKIDAENDWRLIMMLKTEEPIETSTVKINSNTASIANQNVLTEYFNRPEGMEQTFLIATPPPSGDLALTFELQLKGINLSVTDSGSELLFDDGFQYVLKYGGLYVTDATQQRLEARFVQLGSDSFRIQIDSKGAQYPILVDPTITLVKAYSPFQASAHFGYSVAYAQLGAGADGTLVVGAPDYDNGQSNEGSVFVYKGTPAGYPSSPDWTGESNQANSGFGMAVHCADLDGDGYDDLIVGSPYYDEVSYTDAGKVFIWMGSSTNSGFGPNGTPSNADYTRTGTANSYQSFGYSLSSVDVNFNGIVDLIIGAPDSNTGQGAVYVYHCTSSGPSSSPSWTASTSQTNSHFGFSVAGLSHVENTDYGAVAVGAPDYDNGQTDEGAVFIWYGSATGLGSNGTEGNRDVFLEKNQASASFGYSLADGGKVDGSAYSSLVVGTPLYDNGQSNEGAVFVYYGSSSGLPTSSSWMAEGNEAGARLGFSVAGGLDLDEDGTHDDILVGMPYKDNSGTDRGAVYIWLGSSSGLHSGTNGTPSNADYGVTYEGSNNARAGSSVAVGKSLKYRPHPGFIIGIPYADDDYSDSGEASIWYIAP